MSVPSSFDIYSTSPLANGGWKLAMRSAKLASETEPADKPKAVNPWAHGAKLVGVGTAGLLLGAGLGLGVAGLGDHVYRARFGKDLPYEGVIAPAMGILGSALAVSGTKFRDKITQEVRNAFESRRRGG